MSDDYFCQWCYDRGLRYPDNGKPWGHAPGCPNAPEKDPEDSDIVSRLESLHRQATEERSHYYVGKCCRDAIAELARLRAEVQALREENNDLRIGQTEVLSYLKSLHEWFLAKAPEHYKGCGLWIDVDITLKAYADDAAIRAAMRKEGE